jgi:hypothetical protein
MIGNEEIGGSGPIAIDDDYFYSDYYKHVYGQELMTNVLTLNQSETFLSLLTVRSLMDLGLEVDLTQADSYHITNLTQYEEIGNIDYPFYHGRFSKGPNKRNTSEARDNQLHFGNDVHISEPKQIGSVAKPGRERNFEREKEMLLQKQQSVMAANKKKRTKRSKTKAMASKDKFKILNPGG